jgi:hypothetical protein
MGGDPGPLWKQRNPGGSRTFPWAGLPRRHLAPGENCMAFGSPSGMGGQPHPCIYNRVRPPHLPTPDAAPSCRSPVHTKTESSPFVSPCLAVAAPVLTSLLLPIQATSAAVVAPSHPGNERCRRRSFPSLLLPIQATSAAVAGRFRSIPATKRLDLHRHHLGRLLRSDLYLRVYHGASM